jgi:hypothetical protein
MSKQTTVAIVIPHYNGYQILYDCLDSLRKTTFRSFTIYIVNNNSTDDSIRKISKEFTDEQLIIFNLDKNLGYSGGCNYGLDHSTEDYVLFLNNDTIHEPEWLGYMIERMESEPALGALQPKLRSYYKRDCFDYSGACGGELDKFGYPFARGRIFEDIEVDHGQYDHLDTHIFWASGTAMLVRRKALGNLGAFDPDFFAHMEEIDLSWRLQLTGWKIAVEPRSIVYHHSGYTLGKMNPLKMYLNHRNNLLMMYKNLSGSYGASILRKRYILESTTLFYALLKLDFTRFKAVLKGFKDYLKMRHMFNDRREAIAKATSAEQVHFYNRSIVVDYFIHKKKKYSDLSRF